VRISEQGARSRRELLTAIFIQADVEPSAAIGFLGIAGLGARLAGRDRRTFILRDVLVATSRAAHDAIRPAHLADVFEALFVRRKLYEDFGEADRLGMNAL